MLPAAWWQAVFAGVGLRVQGLGFGKQTLCRFPRFVQSTLEGFWAMIQKGHGGIAVSLYIFAGNQNLNPEP